MSKYIDAEWIRNVYADFEHYDNRNDWTTPIANVLAVIDDAPSIDIVRCKECRNFDGFDCNRFGEPAECSNPCSDDGNDFCSFGERKESE